MLFNQRGMLIVGGVALLIIIGITLAIVFGVRAALKAEKKRDKERKLKTNRSFLKCWLFSIITFGIYDLYLIHAVAHDLNTACAGKDSLKTAGFVKCFFLDLVTLGIYSIVWHVKACNRMRDRIEGVGEEPEVSGTSWALWGILGALLFGIGALVAQYKLIHALNHVNSIYNSGR